MSGGENARVSPVTLNIKPLCQAFFMASYPLAPTAPGLGAISIAATKPKFLISITFLSFFN